MQTLKSAMYASAYIYSMRLSKYLFVNEHIILLHYGIHNSVIQCAVLNVENVSIMTIWQLGLCVKLMTHMRMCYFGYAVDH